MSKKNSPPHVPNTEDGGLLYTSADKATTVAAPPSPDKKVPRPDPELQTMARIDRQLAALDPAVARRVLAWVYARYASAIVNHITSTTENAGNGD